MFRKLHLSLIVMLCAITGFAQTIVSTSSENRNVVLEEFTGIYCVYCPDGHAIAQAIQNANPDRVSLINIHVGSFAAPSGNAPDFRTNWGNAIANASGLTGYPAGQVNRHVFPGRGMSGSSTAMGRGSWTVSANEILAMPSYVNLGVEATIDVQTRELVVHVEVYYTGNSPEQTNLLNVALLQNNTKGPQTGGGAGNNYNHMHRLVDLLTGQWGEEITTTTAGSFVDRTFTYTIPADYRDVEAVLRDMKIVAFVSETQKEIMTGNTAAPLFTGITTTNDARVKEIQEIDPICQAQIKPVVVISNEGSATLTSLDIEYEINGESHNYTWTGSLNTFAETKVELPEVSFSLSDTNTLIVSIPDDENNDNNTQTTVFDKAPEGTSTITVETRTDNWGYEFRYEILDSAGEIVFSERNFGNNQTVTKHYELPEDCYQIIIYDSYGDGGARVEVKDSDNLRLFYAAGDWGDKRIGNFSTNGVLNVAENINQSLSIYPNPANNVLNISGVEHANIAIYDILGKEILTKENISSAEGIQISHLQAGAYFLKVTRNGEITTKKFIKQ